MKAGFLSFAFICSAMASAGQTSLSTDEALKQLYHDYDPATKTAYWVCTKEQLSKGMHPGWPCTKELATVSVSVVLSQQVTEGNAHLIYIAASAKPNDPDGDYNCHGCDPAVGAAIFFWKEQRWELEYANSAIAFWGGWGDPPSIDLVAIGPRKHGLIMSAGDLGQGYQSGFKQLAIPIGKSIEVVWGIEDESDDDGAGDPDDRENSPPLYHSSAAVRFIPGQGASDYYNIEVVSHGTSLRDDGRHLKSENWTEIYTFKSGKYRLLHRTTLTEAESLGKATSQ